MAFAIDDRCILIRVDAEAEGDSTARPGVPVIGPRRLPQIRRPVTFLFVRGYAMLP
jgi:hypothetical protein